jgi:hypothetical protein
MALDIGFGRFLWAIVTVGKVAGRVVDEEAIFVVVRSSVVVILHDGVMLLDEVMSPEEI